MIGTRRVLIPGNNDAYMRRVLATNPVAYWPLNERVGSVTYDISGNGHHGAPTKVGQGYPGIGDGQPAYYFDGASAFVNIYSAGFAAAFDGTEGTLLTWGRVSNAGVWTDGLHHQFVRLRTDTSNLVLMRILSTGNALQWYANFGGVNSRMDKSISTLDWVCMGLTWSVSTGASGEFRAYYNGAQEGATRTGLGTWAGALNLSYCALGASFAGTTELMFGWLAHGAYWNRPLSPTEMAALGTVR